MLSRTARRLEKTSLLVSRQSLPRPARLVVPRLYSAPSKPAHHPATAAAAQPSPSFEYPPYLPSAPSSSSSPGPSTSASERHDADFVSSFLARPTRFTILPAPLPKDDKAKDTIFTDTVTQDKLAVMDACLYNLHNVPRAKMLFNRLRATNKAILTIDMYNRLLSAYLQMAVREEVGRKQWVHDAWNLFTAMTRSEEDMSPDHTSYALMLYAWHQFRPHSPMSVETDTDRPLDYRALSDLITADPRKPSLIDIVAHPAISTPEIARDIMTQLSRIALEDKDTKTVNALAKAVVIASGEKIDTPDAVAALKHSKDADGNVTSEVPFKIQNLRDHLTSIAYARQVLPDDMVARQRHLELAAYDMAEDRVEVESANLKELGIDTRFHDKKVQEYMHNWHERLRKKLAEEVKLIEKEEGEGMFRNSATELTPYLTLVAPDRLSMITILEIMRLTGTGGISGGMKTTRAIVSIGKAVEMEYKARMCKQNDIQMPESSRPDGNVWTDFGYSNLYQRRLAMAKQMSLGESWTAEWTQLTRAQVGSVLLECLMGVAEVDKQAVDRNTGEVFPAIYHGYEYIRGTKLGVIKVNSAVTDRLAKDPLSGTIHPRYLPMLIPPKPWVGPNEGGYLFSRASLMRFKESVEQEKYLRESIGEGRAELVMEGLNVLGRTPWRINKPVFDVVLKVWNAGERLGKVPPAVYDKPEPALPEDESDLNARSRWIEKKKLYEQAVANNHSDRCSVNYKIEIARTFQDETIYFPHNLDFRGRAYPIPPHLNHIGDDLSRGLLKFADSKPLGVRGFRWLKIHLANLHGFDKADFDGRVDWVDQRLELIKDSAKNPLGGERWWMKADDPWQCLATCFDLTAALESGDPLAYESSLPVHQDGTCNGLQHYAAMGGDAVGAAQVNLAPVDRPSDVYTFVKDKVDKLIEKDAENGNEYAQALVGKITRKVVKQTVMTTVYGVTFVGARDQLHKQLEDRGDISPDMCWVASAYLAKQVLMCIGDTFKGAKGIMNYLNLCARLISKSISPLRFNRRKEQATKKVMVGVGKLRKVVEEAEASGAKKVQKGQKKVPVVGMANFRKEQMTSVVWTTALGLPIVQPYRKLARKQVMTNLQSVFISDPNVQSEVNTMKQASAFPPNFVHSLDATHMMLTAIECSRQDLTFASVHDSYWTHACDIDEMSKVIRRTFIKLHDSERLRKLHEEFMERYKGYLVPIMHLQQNTTLNKKLVEAGVRVKMTAEKAKHYAMLGKLVEVVEEQDAGASTAVIEDVSLPSAAAQAADILASLGMAEEDVVESKVETKEKEERRVKMEVAERNLLNKFIDVTSVLPPVPDRGTFDVNQIKESQYFFS
ncbi:mitochondrial RNA polymerase [Coprinellus micaceus]|uniref:DNA-directed RNA polymerase n=1 Tax=Coprinellus micaceus TaxID=71717 RepID=A0A4Y7SA33_COPMI|nr:mitochondrial RNA polymerase [Coprinellus micaceus]